MKLKGEIALVSRNPVVKPEAVTLTRAKKKLLDAAASIRQDPENAEWAFMARQLVQCTLPHRNPGNVPVWSRTNGNLTLSIFPQLDRKTGLSLGYPYGVIPRLLLFWIVTEAKHTGSRRLELGHSLAQFMHKVGLNPDNGTGTRSDARRLRMQMQRLFRATISFEKTMVQAGRHGESWLDMQVAPEGEFWWDPKQPEQSVLWGSWIELGEKFYEAVMAAPIPYDMRALRALKRSPLALDAYAVLNYRAHTAKEPVFLSWELLMKQFGSELGTASNFRLKMVPTLRKVLSVQPHLKVVQVKGGLVIYPSRPAIAPRPKEEISQQ
jgi:hypothetical protein